MNHVTYEQGEVIFREGTYGETMYEITAGKVGIYGGYGEDDQQLIATLGKGESFGEMGVIEAWTRSATAVALADGTTADEIDANEFMDYLQAQPDKALSIMRQLSVRLRKTDKNCKEARRTIYEAVEAEAVGARREKGLRSRLSSMINHFRRNKN